MIIVLLLFFQSICLYCQRLVLHIHDRWINPKNVRLLQEAAESSPASKKLLLQQQTEKTYGGKATRKRCTAESSVQSVLGDTCQFCANTPQGYCRHHFHLQELELQKQQQPRFWNPLSGGGNVDKSKELRQLRKINRQLKRNLKNRLNFHQEPQHQQQQQQQQQQQPHRAQIYETYSSEVSNLSNISNIPKLSQSSSSGLNSSSTYDDTLRDLSSASIVTSDSGIATTESTIEATY